MSGGGTGWAVVNGRLAPLAEAALAITDDGAVRGDGAFEAVGVWGGGPFRLADHLARLAASLTAIGLPAADTELLAAQAWGLLESLGPSDAVLRFYVTASATSVVVLADQPIRVPPRRLVPQPAPWIRPLGSYPAAGAKTMSYGPNMAATRAAVRAGGDDALLYSLEGYVLEGPTFCVLWARDGELRSPTVELGIVDSISRRALAGLASGLGYPVVEGRWRLEELERADEVMVLRGSWGRRRHCGRWDHPAGPHAAGRRARDRARPPAPQGLNAACWTATAAPRAGATSTSPPPVGSSPHQVDTLLLDDAQCRELSTREPHPTPLWLIWRVPMPGGKLTEKGGTLPGAAARCRADGRTPLRATAAPVTRA